MLMFPSEGPYNPASSLRIVDFPDPEGQTNAMVSPALTEKLRCERVEEVVIKDINI